MGRFTMSLTRRTLTSVNMWDRHWFSSVYYGTTKLSGPSEYIAESMTYRWVGGEQRCNGTRLAWENAEWRR
jgi:hypothetical protein